MNWDAIGALGELVGAVAVVVSIIYLALQVRQNSADVRSGGYQGAVQSANQFLESLTGDPESRKIFTKALESFDELDEDGQVVARMLFLQLFMYYEAFYYQYLEGVVNEEIWEGRKIMMLNMLESPGISSWWEGGSAIYGRRFVNYVNEVREPTTEGHYSFMLGRELKPGARPPNKSLETDA